MILTITANPLIDRTLHLPSFRLGQIHRTTRISEIAGGKGVNVARMVKILGEPVHAITFAGGGYGNRLKELLEQEGIPNSTIQTLSPTRFQVSILDNSNGLYTDILDQGTIVSNSELDCLLYETENLLKTKRDVQWLILSGSAPQGKADHLYYELIKIAHKYNIKTILDSYGEIFKQGIKAKPYCIKPNLKEAEILHGKELYGKVNILNFINGMLDSGIQLPIVSLGKDGVIAGHKGKYWEVRPPKIKAVNAVGSGDAFVGALAVALTRGHSIPESLQWGVAAGTANAMNSIPCGCTSSQISQILSKVHLREISLK
jgi:tagatose 6-phosphate kinase